MRRAERFAASALGGGNRRGHLPRELCKNLCNFRRLLATDWESREALNPSEFRASAACWGDWIRTSDLLNPIREVEFAGMRKPRRFSSKLDSTRPTDSKNAPALHGLPY